MDRLTDRQTDRQTDRHRNELILGGLGIQKKLVPPGTLFYFTLFCCGGKANLVRFTLFYSTLLTLMDGQTDRQTDRGMNTLALRGLVEPFSSCAVVSVFCSGGK